METYYHVRITKRSDRTHDTVELDLSKEELMKRIVEPYKKGKTFMCNGQPIDPFDIEKIQINKTDDPSSVILPRIRVERAKSEVVVVIPDEWYVTEKGRMVTREFITSSPKKRSAFPEIPLRKGLEVVSLIALSFIGMIVVIAIYCQLMNLSFIEFTRSNPQILIFGGILLFGTFATIRYVKR